MSGLLTDLYEINMAVSYLRRGMRGSATFSLFVRKVPPSRGFLVAAGLEDGLAALEGFRFEHDELSYLAEIGFAPEDVERLSGLRFTGDVWAVPEGRVVLAGEPLLEVTAPIAEAQLVETLLLNLITYPTTIASKAARVRIAADSAQVVDFAFRRAPGLDAAMTVARVSAIAGFASTSNVEAARRYGLAASGTMAHSYILAIGEDAAFRGFAQDFPDRVTFLVDTYDTLEGVRKAIAVTRELALPGPVAIRLDSGDLLSLSGAARAMLDEAGLRDCGIIVSGGLDEHDIDDLVRAGAPIDGYGVGTRLGVSADAPVLDTAYKLVEFEGRPVIKLSTGKASSPGAKQVFRSAGFEDVIGRRGEDPPPGSRPLLEQVMADGERTAEPDTLDAARARLAEDLEGLPAPALRIRDPVAPEARLSDAVVALTAEARTARV